MDGRDSVGRRISLLNESVAGPSSYRFASQPSSLHSRTSSYTSTPCLSPQTPQLVRSDSADSAVMNTPSPITPTYNFDQQNVSPVFPTNAGFSPSTKEPLAAYPPPHPHHGGPLPYPTSDIPLTVYAPPLVPQSQPTQPTPAQAAKPQSKKNQYPCPMAKQFNCSDYFTTSGHAARHAKKHTGKKDAFCPECNKAFTRKDNMEQHRRTHQSGRNAGKGAEESRAKKAKHSPQSKRPKPAPLQAAPLNVLDPSLPISPTSSFGAPAVQPYVSEYMQTSPYSETFPYPPYHMSPSFAHGLETLAIAASGEKRKFEAS